MCSLGPSLLWVSVTAEFIIFILMVAVANKREIVLCVINQSGCNKPGETVASGSRGLGASFNLLSPGPLKTSATQYKNDKILNSLYVSKLDFKRFFHVS